MSGSSILSLGQKRYNDTMADENLTIVANPAHTQRSSGELVAWLESVHPSFARYSTALEACGVVDLAILRSLRGKEVDYVAQVLGDAGAKPLHVMQLTRAIALMTEGSPPGTAAKEPAAGPAAAATAKTAASKQDGEEDDDLSRFCGVRLVSFCQVLRCVLLPVTLVLIAVGIIFGFIIDDILFAAPLFHAWVMPLYGLLAAGFFWVVVLSRLAATRFLKGDAPTQRAETVASLVIFLVFFVLVMESAKDMAYRTPSTQPSPAYRFREGLLEMIVREEFNAGDAGESLFLTFEDIANVEELRSYMLGTPFLGNILTCANKEMAFSAFQTCVIGDRQQFLLTQTPTISTKRLRKENCIVNKFHEVPGWTGLEKKGCIAPIDNGSHYEDNKGYTFGGPTCGVRFRAGTIPTTFKNYIMNNISYPPVRGKRGIYSPGGARFKLPMNFDSAKDAFPDILGPGRCGLVRDGTVAPMVDGLYTDTNGNVTDIPPGSVLADGGTWCPKNPEPNATEPLVWADPGVVGVSKTFFQQIRDQWYDISQNPPYPSPALTVQMIAANLGAFDIGQITKRFVECAVNDGGMIDEETTRALVIDFAVAARQTRLVTRGNELEQPATLSARIRLMFEFNEGGAVVPSYEIYLNRQARMSCAKEYFAPPYGWPTGNCTCDSCRRANSPTGIDKRHIESKVHTCFPSYWDPANPIYAQSKVPLPSKTVVLPQEWHDYETGRLFPQPRYRYSMGLPQVTEGYHNLLALSSIALYLFTMELERAVSGGFRNFCRSASAWTVLTMVGLAFTAFGFTIAGMSATPYFSVEISDAKAGAYRDEMQDTASTLMAVLAGLCWVRAVHYLGLIPQFQVLSTTLVFSASEAAFFTIILFFVAGGFSTAIFFLTGDSLEQYSSFSRTLVTSTKALLGEFDYESLEQADPFIGPLLGVLFQALSVFFLVTVFVAIVTDGFERAAEQHRGHDDGGGDTLTKKKTLDAHVAEAAQQAVRGAEFLRQASRAAISHTAIELSAVSSSREAKMPAGDLEPSRHSDDSSV